MFASWSTFHFLFASVWLVSSLLAYSEFLYYWQLKEYRLDRMRDFLHSAQGKAFISSYAMFARMAMSLFLLFLPFNSLIVRNGILLVYSLDTLYGLFRLYRHRLKTPHKTAKIMFLLSFSLLLDAYLIIIKDNPDVAVIVFVLRPLLVSVVVLLCQLPTRLIKFAVIYIATKKMKRFPHILVIGVTGSYGKSTVKEMLYYLLSAKFRVWKTSKNINTDIGVAKVIISSKLDDIDVMIVEMGAYTIGEIKAICDIVNPKIGILTAINEQHISLFGSISRTQTAKYELLQSLPKDGLAIINSDCKYIREKINEIICPVLSFGWEGEYKPDCQIINVNELSVGINVDLSVFDKKHSVFIPLLGIHHAMNMSPVFLTARHLGMSEAEIIERFKTLPQPGRGLQMYQYGKSIVIDDSYNSNPDGFRAALYLMARFSSGKRRVVVTRGMIELGDESERLHEQIAGEISFAADELILITKDHEAAFRRGAISQKYHLDIKVKTDFKDLEQYLLSLKDMEAVILLENRLPVSVYKSIEPFFTPIGINT